MTKLQRGELTKKDKISRTGRPMIISIIGTEKDKGLKKSFMYKKSSTVQKLESNQPKIFMRYLNVDRFSGRRRKKSWIT